jgi:hypothetical protein
MSVPKASVNKNRRTVTRKNKVWTARISTIVNSEAKAAGVQKASYDYLWAGVPPFDTRHDLASFLCGEVVQSNLT